MFLIFARHEARYVFKCYDWNIERVAEINESCALDARIYIKRAGHNLRLVSYDAYCVATETSEADYEILCEVFCHFEETTFVYYEFDDVAHVIRFIWILRHNVTKAFFYAVCGVVGRKEWGVFNIV